VQEKALRGRGENSRKLKGKPSKGEIVPPPSRAAAEETGMKPLGEGGGRGKERGESEGPCVQAIFIPGGGGKKLPRKNGRRGKKLERKEL